ncbi:MAG: PAS domain S-box protein [Nanoarchaeota archaeon]
MQSALENVSIMDFTPEHIEALQSALPDTVVIYTVTGTILAVSSGSGNLPFKKDRQLEDCVDDEVSGRIMTSTKKVIRTRQRDTVTFELSMGSSARQYEAYIAPAGSTELIMVIHDMTVESKAMRSLVESEYKFRIVSEKSPNVIFINQGNRILYVNNTVEQLLGYSPDQIMSEDFSFLDIVPSDQKERIQKMVKDILMSEERPRSVEHSLHTRTGETVQVYITGRRIHYEGKAAVLGVIVDITPLRRMEENLDASKRQLENIVNSASELIIGVDKKGRVFTWNASLEHLSGVSRKSVYGKSIHSNAFPKRIENLVNACRESLENGRAKAYDLAVQDNNGQVTLVLGNTSLIRAQSGRVEGIVFVGRSVAHRAARGGQLSPGTIYLHLDRNCMYAIQQVQFLREQGYKLMTVSRHDTAFFMEHDLPVAQHLSLSDISSNHSGGSTASTTREILASLELFLSTTEKACIFITHPEYISIMNSFQAMMRLFYQLHDKIMQTPHVVFMCSGRHLWRKRELSILENEFQLLEQQEAVVLERPLKDVLLFVAESQQQKIPISFKDVSARFNLSRFTTKKRIDELLQRNFVGILQRGNHKYLFLKEKGQDFIDLLPNE